MHLRNNIAVLLCTRIYVTCFYISAPEKPRNITLDILTISHKDINVRYVNATLSWIPPEHTNNGGDVLRYILVYRKEPPYDVVKHLEPHKAERIINNVNIINIQI